LIGAAQFVPIHPKLKLPKIILVESSKPKPLPPALTAYFKAKQIPVTDTSVCVVGDSAAALAPWPYIKIAMPGKSCLDLPDAVATFAGSPELFIIMTGTWLMSEDRSNEIKSETDKITKIIRQRFHEAKIVVVPHSEYLSIASQHTIDGGFHLDKVGYDLLYSRYLKNHNT